MKVKVDDLDDSEGVANPSQVISGGQVVMI